MAYSTTSEYLQTGTQIMTEALELVGAIEAGDTISSVDSTSTLRTLNTLLKAWSADIQLYSQETYTLDLVASTSEYSLAIANVGYIPLRVLQANTIDSDSIETPLRELTTQEWYALTDKTVTGRPTQFWQKRDITAQGVDFFLWPTPEDTTYDVKLWLQHNIRDVDAVGDDVWVPQEWFLALSYALAAYIAPKYGVEINERRDFLTIAERLRDEAKSFDHDPSVFLQPDRRHG